MTIPGIEEVSAVEMRAGLEQGDFTVRALVQACLDRIAAMDRTGPSLGAVIETNPEALDIADTLDAELREGRSRGPLHGIPVLVKDNIATADGMQNTAGSLALEGGFPLRDAFVVSRLREAGAVVLGKTNLSEWANIRDGLSSSGWSARGGQTLNPYQIDRSPSGSSSGSAVAVAASYAPLSLGTETNGSICSPAGTCGLVGIKPTIGLLSRSGIIPISQLQDTPGPMTRTVADAALLLTAMLGDDPADAAQVSGEARFPARPEGGLLPVDYTRALDADGLRGARIGVWREPLARSTVANVVFEEALDQLRAAGAELVDPVIIPSGEAMRHGREILQVMLWNLKHDLADYLRDNIAPDFPIQGLADVVAFNREHAAREMPWFGQDLLEMALKTGSLDDPEYLDMVRTVQRWGREDGLDAVLREQRLDAIISAANGPAWRIDLVNGDHQVGGSSTPSAIAGYPIVTVPAGFSSGLPVGLNFMGTAYSEETLIRLAYSFEQATRVRRAPAYAAPGILPPDASWTA